MTTQITEYPTVEKVLDEMQKTNPVGWRLTYEYPDSIGVWHNDFTSDDQFIMFGDVNGYFGFNDVPADPICGSMEGVYEPAEIVKSFWDQMKEFYPELFRVSTYHGLIKVSCILCEYETKSVSEMEMLNDLDGTCPRCDKQFFRWENQDGSVVVSLIKDLDGRHTYENLTEVKG
jgi:hypothetical protein